MNRNSTERRKERIDLEQIKNDVSGLRTDVALLSKTVDMNHKSLRDELIKIENELNSYDKSLYGNGMNPGQSIKIDRIEQTMKDFEEHVCNDNRLFMGIFGLLVTLLLGIGKIIFFK